MLAALMPFFAAATEIPLDTLPTAPRAVGGMRIQDILLVMLPVVFIMLLLVVWAIFIRKPKNEHGRTRVYKAKEDVEELDDGTVRKKKRHKHPRREHRTRNPTLAEAGGLPPMRSEDGPPPP